MLKIATVICLLISVLFLEQASAFADEAAWTALASMSASHVTSSDSFQTEVVNGKIILFTIKYQILK
ncbi:MAG: hypothetical protein LBT06_10160 [Hungatella sp.]|jgi:hypothetical protein|nr:hypothetical protein [Hungatella sp.]